MRALRTCPAENQPFGGIFDRRGPLQVLCGIKAVTSCQNCASTV